MKLWEIKADLCSTQLCSAFLLRLIKSHSSLNLLVVDVYSDPLAQHQFQGGRVAELHSGFHDQVNALVGRRDAIEVHRVVNGGVPGAHC